jgi:NAD(P)-dependent dehydrogenase (short-subunit alcohol dehydrogenase family)
MINRRAGTIVNVSSAAGVLPVKERAAYATSKAGVSMLTHVQAVGWAEFGITVNAVAPTFIETDLGRQTLADPAVRAALTEQIPLGRVATVDDAAAAVGYPVSPAAKFITATILPVDDGVAMR